MTSKYNKYEDFVINSFYDSQWKQWGILMEQLTNSIKTIHHLSFYGGIKINIMNYIHKTSPNIYSKQRNLSFYGVMGA